MLNHNVEARKSRINGIGLFANDDIKRGEIIWSLDDTVIQFTLDDIKNIPEKLQEFILRYVGSYGEILTLDTDQSIFLNHSCTPNVGLAKDGITEIAIKDIKMGDELTINYLDFSINKILDFKCNCVKHKL